MPYVRRGNTIYKRVGDSLEKVGTSDNPEKYLNTLRAVAHGFKPRRRK